MSALASSTGRERIASPLIWHYAALAVMIAAVSGWQFGSVLTGLPPMSGRMKRSGASRSS